MHMSRTTWDWLDQGKTYRPVQLHNTRHRSDRQSSHRAGNRPSQSHYTRRNRNPDGTSLRRAPRTLPVLHTPHSTHSCSSRNRQSHPDSSRWMNRPCRYPKHRRHCRPAKSHHNTMSAKPDRLVVRKTESQILRNAAAR